MTEMFPRLGWLLPVVTLQWLGSKRGKMYNYQGKLCLLKKKKCCTTWKLRIMFYLVALLSVVALDIASQTALRSCSKEVGEELGYVGVFAGRREKSDLKITANHKKKTSQVLILVPLYLWGNAGVWACWNYSFDTHLNYLGPFFHPEFPSGAPLGWGWAAGADDFMATTFLFTEMAGNFFFLCLCYFGIASLNELDCSE